MPKTFKITLIIFLGLLIILTTLWVWFLKKPVDIFYIPDNMTIDPSWAGEYVLEDSTQDYKGILTIENITQDSLFFTLLTYNGAHTGDISGNLYLNEFTYPHMIFYYTEANCYLTFYKYENNITIETTNMDCISGRGARGFFAGTYIKNGRIQERGLADIVSVSGGSNPTESTPEIFKNENEIQIFQNLVGQEYVHLFTNSFQIVFQQDDLENLNARIYTGGVAGMYTLMEGIIIIGESNKIWAAAIDNNVVRYFTNVPAYINTLPETIERWRERFLEYEVIYMNL